ncbi:hypothetical protein HDU96_010734, partial [Phlyctochytrium bullatum]
MGATSGSHDPHCSPPPPRAVSPTPSPAELPVTNQALTTFPWQPPSPTPSTTSLDDATESSRFFRPSTSTAGGGGRVSLASTTIPGIDDAEHPTDDAETPPTRVTPPPIPSCCLACAPPPPPAGSMHNPYSPAGAAVPAPTPRRSRGARRDWMWGAPRARRTGWDGRVERLLEGWMGRGEESEEEEEEGEEEETGDGEEWERWRSVGRWVGLVGRRRTRVVGGAEMAVELFERPPEYDIMSSMVIICAFYVGMKTCDETLMLAPSFLFNVLPILLQPPASQILDAFLAGMLCRFLTTLYKLRVNFRRCVEAVHERVASKPAKVEPLVRQAEVEPTGTGSAKEREAAEQASSSTSTATAVAQPATPRQDPTPPPLPQPAVQSATPSHPRRRIPAHRLVPALLNAAVLLFATTGLLIQALAVTGVLGTVAVWTGIARGPAVMGLASPTATEGWKSEPSVPKAVEEDGEGGLG